MLYLDMALGSSHGWGVVGKNLARELARLEPVRVISEPLQVGAIGDVLEFHELKGLMLSEAEAARFQAANGVRVADGPLLQGIGDEKLMPRRGHLRGVPTIGHSVFERNLLQPAWVENGRRHFDRIAAGSTWCSSVLAEAGLPDVATVVQGIDPTVFYPSANGAARRQFLADNFVVFSGGKFEFRKGQDVVIRAYKALQDRHGDVMLVNAWRNPWPGSFLTMHSSPLINFTPGRGTCEEVINQVLADNGIDLRRVITCPQMLNFTLPRLYWNTDVGIFPNRCEGGTNLVLMEYMACGKPVVALSTTGHADIVNSTNALMIETRGETTLRDPNHVPVARWPEPDSDDAVDKLEWAYQNREKMRELGRQAGADLAERTWRKTAQAFRKIIQEASDACNH